MRIFLDLDGIIRDFIKGIADIFEIDYDENKLDHWWSMRNMIIKKWGISAEGIYASLPYSFWVNLPKTQEADEILEFFEPYKPIIFTAPVDGSTGPTQYWIERNLPNYYKEGRYLMGAYKQALAFPGALLIDDSERNCEQFEEWGGSAILYPRPWNKNRDKYEDRVSFLKKKFKTILRESTGGRHIWDWYMNCV